MKLLLSLLAVFILQLGIAQNSSTQQLEDQYLEKVDVYMTAVDELYTEYEGVDSTFSEDIPLLAVVLVTLIEPFEEKSHASIIKQKIIDKRQCVSEEFLASFFDAWELIYHKHFGKGYYIVYPETGD